MQVQSLGWEDPLEEGLATHSSILAWRIPWTRTLVGYSPYSHRELDMTEETQQAHRYFAYLCEYVWWILDLSSHWGTIFKDTGLKASRLVWKYWLCFCEILGRRLHLSLCLNSLICKVKVIASAAVTSDTSSLVTKLHRLRLPSLQTPATVWGFPGPLSLLTSWLQIQRFPFSPQVWGF